MKVSYNRILNPETHSDSLAIRHTGTLYNVSLPQFDLISDPKAMRQAFELIVRQRSNGFLKIGINFTYDPVVNPQRHEICDKLILNLRGITLARLPPVSYVLKRGRVTPEKLIPRRLLRRRVASAGRLNYPGAASECSQHTQSLGQLREQLFQSIRRVALKVANRRVPSASF